MVKTRLFERIARESLGNKRFSHENDRDVVESIVNHLNRLLNTRRGSVAIANDYGLPDFNDLVRKFPDAIDILKNEIRRCIEKYEPRLTHVLVEYVRDPDAALALKYDITAQVVFSDHRANINIETRIDASGRVELKG